MFSVLYVDDEPDLLEIGKIFLEQDGVLRVDTISSALAALALPNMGMYDAIVADYQMPEMDGIEFLRNIRKSGNNTPFILFTGRGREEIVIQALNEGADFYLQKGGNPVPQFTELSHKIHRAILQKKAETGVVLRESYLSAIIENQPGLVWLKDRQGRFLATNRAFALSCGKESSADVTGKTDLDIWPRELAEKYRADDARVIEQKTAIRVEETIFDRHEKKWFETFKMPIKDTAGKVIGTTGVAYDITERKKAEDALRQSEESLRRENLKLTTIHEMEREFAGLSSDKRVEKSAAIKLLVISDALVTTFNIYDRARQVLRAAAIEIAPGVLRSLPDAREMVTRMVGMDPLDITVPVTPEMYQDINRSYITTKKTITELCNGKIPAMVSAAIQKIAGIDRFILITHIIDGELYGTSLIGLRADQPDPQAELLDSFAHMVAVSLRRQQAEEALRESEGRLRSFIEQSREGVTIIDEEGRIIEWNAAQEKITGLSRSETRGVYAWDLATRMIPEESRKEKVRSLMRERIQRTIRTGVNSEQEQAVFRFVRPDGSIAVTRQTVFLIKTPHGHLLGTLNQDVTDEECAQQRLKESEEKFRSLVEYSLESTSIIDFTGKGLFANRATARLLELDEESGAFGRNVMEFLAPGSREQAAGDFARVAAGRDTYLVRYTLVTAKGNTRHVECIGKIINYEGNKAILISLHDITGLSRAEERLRAANRQLTLLSGITRHDILNKVSVIRGFLQMAKRKSTDPAIASFLDRIETEADAVRSQIEFTRVYQDLGTHEPQWMALADVVPSTSLPPSVSLSMDGKDVRIFADPMLKTVFSNLLDNTLRHGGEQVTAIRVFAGPGGNDLTVVWEDNGVGIAATDKEWIFERGFGKNTGLGLFLSREILSLTDITIRENGEPGKGARFELTVPKGAYRLAGE